MAEHLVIIDQANIKDVPALLALHEKAYVAAYRNFKPELTERVLTHHLQSSRERRQRTYLDCISTPHHSSLFVARRGSEIVGYGMATVEENGRHWNSGGFVAESERKKGIGSSLTRERVIWHNAQEGQPVDVYLYVVPNTPAVIFHRKKGFLPTGERSSVPIEGGYFLPQMEMRLSVQDQHKALALK